MPPPSPYRRPGCNLHCVVWLRAMDGQLIRRCAHCLAVIGRHDLVDDQDALRDKQVQSVTAHNEFCSVPFRGADAPTSPPKIYRQDPVQAAVDRVHAARARRHRESRHEQANGDQAPASAHG